MANVKISDLPSATNLAATDVIPANASSVTSKIAWSVLAAKTGNVTSVKDPTYGAVGDGTTVDTVAVQAAFNAGTSRVYLPPGTYLCNPLTITSTLTVFGQGTIKANADSANLILVSATNSVLDGIGLTGTGNFSDSTAIAANDRVCLVKFTAANGVVRNCTMTNAYEIFIHFYQVTGCSAEGNRLIGGITTFADTGYQGIRGDSVTNCMVANNKVIANGTGKTQEAIVFAQNSGTQADITVIGNQVYGCHDHGVYVIGAENVSITGNTFFTDGAGIVYTSVDGWNGGPSWTNYAGASITGNTCRKDGGANQVGIYLRDCNNTTCVGNSVEGHPVGIQMTPVQYNTTSNRISNNVIAHNSISGISVAGISIALGGLSLGQMMNNRVEGNVITGTSAAVTELGISWSVGTVDAQHNAIVGNQVKDVGGEGIITQGQEWMTISRNKLRNVGTAGTMAEGIQATTCDQLVCCDNELYSIGNDGILLTTCTNFQCNGNKIIDAGTETNATYHGINLSNSDDGDVMNNWIESQSATANKIISGITGNNTSTGIRAWNNTVLRSTSNIACRQFQQFTNDMQGNRISTATLTGAFTFASGSSVNVANTNVQTGAGTESQLVLYARNTAAGVLMGSASYPYSATLTAAVAFTMRTADGASASGTENFGYILLQ